MSHKHHQGVSIQWPFNSLFKCLRLTTKKWQINTLLVLYEGNPPVTGDSPHKGPVFQCHHEMNRVNRSRQVHPIPDLNPGPRVLAAQHTSYWTDVLLSTRMWLAWYSTGSSGPTLVNKAFVILLPPWIVNSMCWITFKKHENIFHIYHQFKTMWWHR